MSFTDKDLASFTRPLSVPALRDKPLVTDPAQQAWIDSVHQALSLLLGMGPLGAKAMTYRDQFDAGLVRVLDGSTVLTGNPTGPVIPTTGEDPDTLIPPPTPFNLQASGAFSTIVLTWQTDDSHRVAYAEVWSAGTDDIGQAVQIGLAASGIYVDSVGGSASRYYWVRNVGYGSVPLKSAFNALAGTLGTTGTDPAYVLALLANQITTTQLAGALNTRINLIDGNGTGSVNERIASGDAALSQQIALLTAGANQTFDQFKLWAFDASVESWTATNATIGWANGNITYTSPSGVVSLTSPTLVGTARINGDAYQQVRFRLKRTAGTGWSVTLRWQENATWRSKTVTDPVIAIGEYDAALVDLSAEANWLGKTIDRFELQLDSATGSTYELDWFAVGRDGPAASFAALQTEITTRADADTALAQSVTTLTATVDGKASTAALQTEASVRAQDDGYLYAQKFTKIDLNGFIVGYGIAASTNPATGATESDMIFRVNRFSIVPPSGATGAAAPFVYQATPTVVNGVAVPAGLYLSDIFVSNGSIVNAKIGNLAVDDAKIANMNVNKLLAGEIQVGRFIQSSGYSPGATGWRINGDGTAEFAAASIRGQLTAAQISVTTLSSLSSNLGAITGGSININGTFIVNGAGQLTATSAFIRGDIQASSLTANSVTTSNLVAGAATVVAVGSQATVNPSVWGQVITANPLTNGSYFFASSSELDVQVEAGDVLVIHSMLRGVYSNLAGGDGGALEVVLATDILRPGSGKWQWQPNPTFTTGNFALESETWDAKGFVRNIRLFTMPYEWTAPATEIVKVCVGGGMSPSGGLSTLCSSNIKVRIERIRR